MAKSVPVHLSRHRVPVLNLRHVSTCHIQVVGEAEEERPGVTGQIVANPFNHPVKVRRVRRALNTDHPGSSLSARDLAENSIYVKHCFFL